MEKLHNTYSKKTTLLLFLFCIPFFAWAQGETKMDEVWRLELKGVVAQDFVAAPFITLDNAENIYVAGSFEKNLRLSKEKKLTSAGSYDIFVAKYNKTGNLLWVNQLGNESKEQIGNLRILENKLYMFGNRIDTTYSETAETLSNGYMVCMDLNGTIEWTKTENETHSIFPKIDQEGKMYLTHRFKGVSKLSETVTVEEKSRYHNSFLAKYDSANQLKWSFLLDETPHIYRTGKVESAGLAVDNKGEIYVAGTFKKTPFFKRTQVKSGSSDDVFLAKYTTEGELAWILQLTHSSHEYHVHKVYINHEGHVCIKATSLDPNSHTILPILHTYQYAPGGSATEANQRYTWMTGEKMTNDLKTYDYSDWVLTKDQKRLYKIGVTSRRLYISKFEMPQTQEK